MLVPFMALAADTPAAFDLEAVVQSGVTSVQADILGVLTIVVPAIVVVVGAVVGVKFAVRWLRSLGKG